MPIDDEFRELLRVLYDEDLEAARALSTERHYPFYELFSVLSTEGHAAARTWFEEAITSKRQDSDERLVSSVQNATVSGMPAWLPQDTTMYNLYMYGKGSGLHWEAFASLVWSVNPGSDGRTARTVRTVLGMTDEQLWGLEQFDAQSLQMLDAYLLQELGVSRGSSV